MALLGRLRNFNHRASGLLGNLIPPNDLGGLLSPEEAQEAQRRGQMQLATSLLQSAGPSLMPQSFGQSFGGAYQNALGAQDQAVNQAIQRQMMPLEMQLLQAQIAQASAPAEVDPEYQIFRKGNDPSTDRTLRVDTTQGRAEGDSLLSQGYNVVRTPAAQVNIGQETPFNVPSGYMLADSADPTKGVVPIPGGPETRQPPEQAAKTAQLEVAQDSLNQAYEIIAPEGAPDRAAIATMRANVPFTDGRRARVFMRDAIEARIRAESGAAVPESEIVRALERLMPSPLDDDQTIAAKKQVFVDFISTALGNIDPTREVAPAEVVDSLIQRLDAVAPRAQGNNGGFSIREIPSG